MATGSIRGVDIYSYGRLPLATAELLLILVCYVAYTAKYLTYLLKSTEVIQIWEFDKLHMTQCAKIIVGFMANVGNVFYPTFTNVFF